MITKFNSFVTNPKNNNTFLNLVGGGLLIGLVFIISWASYKSFEITDEGIYTKIITNGINTDNPISYFHDIYTAFFGFLNLTLAQNRLLNFILIIASSRFLAYQAAIYFSIKNKTTLWLIVLIFGCLPYVRFPMAVSYNSFSNILIALILALGFAYARLNKFYLMALIGGFSTLLILNKFTNVVFLFSFFVGLFFLKRKEFKIVATSLPFFIIGLLIALFLFFPSLSLLEKAYKDLGYGLSLSASHSLTDMLIGIYTNLKYTILITANLIPLLLVLLFIKYPIVKFQRIKKQETLIIAGTILSTFSYILLTDNYLLGLTKIFHFHYFICLSALLLVFFYGQLKTAKTDLLLGLFFLIVPFIGSAGTNNSLLVQFIAYGNSIGLGFFIIIKNIPNQLLRTLLLFLLMTVTAVQVSFNKVVNPYRAANLTTQTIPIKGIPYLEKIKVDQQTALLINELKEFRNHPAKKVFLCSHQLGVSIIIDKAPLLFSWINKDSYHLIGALLENKKHKLDQSILFFIPSEEEEKTAIIEQLSTSKELRFLSDYQYLKTIKINENELDIFERKI